MKIELMTLAVVLTAVSFGAPKTAVDLPVSAIGNTACMSSMSERPWWNKAWTRRAPLMVSSTVDVEDRNVMVDAIVDFGEAVNPDEVRIVTPWEEEVPCVCEKVRRTDRSVRSNEVGKSSEMNGQECPFSGKNGQECPFSETALRLLFKTTLRVRENKPFLVYWGCQGEDALATKAGVRQCGQGEDALATKNGAAGRQGAKQCGQGVPALAVKTPVSSLQMIRSEGEIRILNGVLDVTFDLQQRTRGLLRRLRVLGSQAPSALQMRSTDYAWDGFFIGGSMGYKWTNATVVADNPYKKSIAFRYPRGTVTMTVYDEQPRVDWAYTYSPDMNITLSWACAGDTGFDRIYYPGLSGKTLSVMAALDSQTDCIPHPNWDFHNFLGKGWYAIADRRERDVVGMIFDRSALTLLHSSGDGGAYGLGFDHRFHLPGVKQGGTGEGGSGAIVARSGTWKDVEAEEARQRSRPLVFTGKAEGVREIPVRVTRLDHDFVHSIDHGGCSEMTPLEGTEWAANAACTWRALGASVMRCGPNWTGVPVSRELYDQVTNKLAAVVPERMKHIAKWGEGDNFTGRKFAEQCAAAHAKGLAVNIWGGFCPASHDLDRADPDLVKYDIELQNLYPKCGMDCVYNAAAQGEGSQHTLPMALKKAHKNEAWQRWPDLEEFLKAQDENTERVKTFYREAKKRNPDKPVVMWNSACCVTEREMFMSDQVGFFDTCMVEIMPNDNFPRAKQSVKEMLAYFDNEPGRTVHHHYYFYGTDRQDYFHRVSDLEMEFVCGCHGFSQENMTYGHSDREAMQIPADFARFAEYTRLGEKVAKMAPVKNLAVFRDIENYRWDVRHREFGAKYGWYTRSDRRVANFARIRNYNYDTVLTPFFTAKALAKYRVVFVPENPALTEERAKELLKYVKAGGSAVLEGVQGVESKSKVEVEERKDSTLRLGLGTSTLTLKDGEVKTFGKGRICWYAKPVSDQIGSNVALTDKVLKRFAEMGGEPPHTLASKTLDSILHASDEGLFLGVYNMGKDRDTGKVSLNSNNQTIKQSNNLYVLDVRAGVRFAFTNGFEIAVGPKQCGFYLIGDDAFTALPEATHAVWDGAGLRWGAPRRELPAGNVPANFTQAVAVEYTRGTAAKPNTTRHSFESMIAVRPMTKDAYTPRKMRDALDGATYLHFVATETAAADQVFADCADDLKAFLKRGGGIVFDRMTTGPKARAFLKDVGVYDPNEAAVNESDNAVICSNLSTNSLLYPLPAGWFNQSLNFSRGFPKWDAKTQFVTHVGKHRPELAMAVAQENVLGAGKVIFAQNNNAFNDWYENMRYGDSIQSWMIGRQVKEHAKLVMDQNGGPGDVEK